MDSVMDYARDTLTVEPCIAVAGKGAKDFRF